jgi:hypothetical protein
MTNQIEVESLGVIALAGVFTLTGATRAFRKATS